MPRRIGIELTLKLIEGIPVGAAWVVLAAEREVADSGDVGGIEVAEHGEGILAVEVGVVPRVLVWVEEDGDVGKGVVASYQVCEVDHGFAAFVGRDKKEFRRSVDSVGGHGVIRECVLEPRDVLVCGLREDVLNSVGIAR